MYRTFGDVEAATREVEYACRRVPFFRAQARQLSDRNRFRLASFPISSKRDYRKNFPAGILADGHTVNDAYVNRLQSSGTSGDRLVSVIHAFKLADRMATCLKLNRNLSFLADVARIRTCRYAAPNCSDVECSNPRSTMEDRILPDGTLVLPVHHDLLTTPVEMLRLAFDELHLYAPHVWYMDPMHLAYLIRKARENGWEFRIPNHIAVLLSYTMTTPVLLRQIAEFCGDRYPIATVLGMSEFGFVGLDCHDGTLHLNNVDYFLEFLNLDPSGNSDLWELIITSIGDKLCPHVRYRTNDIYRLLPGCTCGSSMPAVSFEGRRKDVLVLKSGSIVTPGALKRAVGNPLWMDMYQLAREAPDQYVLRYRGDPAHADESERTELLGKLRDLLESNAVQLQSVEYFPFERGGKFQLMRSSAS